MEFETQELRNEEMAFAVLSPNIVALGKDFSTKPCRICNRVMHLSTSFLSENIF